MAPPVTQPEARQQQWSDAVGDNLQAAADALAALAASRAVPPSAAHVAALLDRARTASPAILLPLHALLARWARQQALQPAAGRQVALLHRAVTTARQLIRADAAAPPTAAGERAQLAAASVLLLGSLAPALADEGLVDAVAEAIGIALASGQVGDPEPGAAVDVMAAVGSLLPTLLGKPVAACWVLSALLEWLSGCAPDGPSYAVVDCMAPAYAMMRGAATASLGRAHPAAAASTLLRPAYAVLKTAVSAATLGAGQLLRQPEVAKAAAAVLAAAGLAEALLRSAAGFAEAAQLAADCEACLVQACAAAAAAEAAGGAGTAEAALLQNACSLAVAQLQAAVGRPTLLAAAGVARCQAWSLLHSALCLAPLSHAAEALLPPAQASQMLRRQLGSALVQQAGSMARGLAAQLGQLDSDMRGWVLLQVQAAAGQAHRDYQRYSLRPPAAWLAAMDGAAVRQLLDRLFISCVLLLAAELEAHAPAAAAASRGQLAASAACVLADLQFCRGSSPPQYAALLRAALAEVPGDASGAAALAACLPCYPELAAPCATRGGQAAWLVNGAAAAKVQFLLGMLTSCCSSLAPSVLEGRVAPVAFLYLLHPHPATAAAAHNLLCALMMAAPLEQRPALAAFYVQRCLEGCPGVTPLPQLAQGLATIHEALPVGSPAALLCLQRLLDKWRELAARDDPSAHEVAALAAQQLLAVDYVLLDGAMAAFDPLLRPTIDLAAAGSGGSASGGDAALAAAAAMRRELAEAVQRSDDCLRKPELVMWLLDGGGSGRRYVPPRHCLL